MNAPTLGTKLSVHLVVFAFSVGALLAQHYSASDGKITSDGGRCFNNRPVYGPNGFLLIAGDRAMVRLANDSAILGSVYVGLAENGSSVWLHDCELTRATYEPGAIEWIVNSPIPAIDGIKLRAELSRTGGLLLNVSARGVRGSPKLIVAVMGVAATSPRSVFDTAVNPSIKQRLHFGEFCAGNYSVSDSRKFSVHNDGLAVYGAVDGETEVRGIRAEVLTSPLALRDMAGSQAILLESNLTGGQPWRVALEARPFAAEYEWRAWEPRREIAVTTPDARLDAALIAAEAAVDAMWRPPFHHHGAMLWNDAFLGWRTMYGSIVFGRHERLEECAAAVLPYQITESALQSPDADPQRRLSLQSEKSRFYGRGRVAVAQAMYDMQTQWFDQVIAAWRASNSSSLSSALPRALALHLEWMGECFDPDENGTYESYLNTWPTDSAWFNGGGTPEQSAYAYTAHRAARDLARQSKNQLDIDHHEKKLQLITSGINTDLWSVLNGRPGSYREQGGLRRLHEDPWINSIAIPIDAGCFDDIQALQALGYARYLLQNEEKPAGGRVVWNSNWVPGIWSIRTDWPGDNYHLALAYFKAGLTDDGWEVLKGTVLNTAFVDGGFGNLGHHAGGYDFGDSTHMFARAVVEGLFGYCPDYPNGSVTFSPSFPLSWNEARLRTPDFDLSYKRSHSRTAAHINLSRPASLTINLKVGSAAIESVTWNGQTINYTLSETPGGTIVTILAPEKAGDLVVTHSKPAEAPAVLFAEIGDSEGTSVHLGTQLELVAVNDPQSVLRSYEWNKNGGLLLQMKTVPALSTVVVHLKHLGQPEKRVIYLKRKPTPPTPLPIDREAKWESLSVSSAFNADARLIFKQRYVSPRPNTVSSRLGVDGWSPWTATFWKLEPPKIEFDRWDASLAVDGLHRTENGVPFLLSRDSRNIGFVSMWDNYPSTMTLPVTSEGRVLWVLLAGSTNPMQCNIANARVDAVTTDGETIAVEIVPPNNFWALAPININGTAAGQVGRNDYDDPHDAFCVPYRPELLRLGRNFRSCAIPITIPPGRIVKEIRLTALSQEVVIGIMAATMMK